MIMVYCWLDNYYITNNIIDKIKYLLLYNFNNKKKKKNTFNIFIQSF